MFYLFFPLTVRLLLTQKLLIPLLMLFVIAGPFARIKAFNPNPVWREYCYLGGMDAIAMGFLVALLLSNKRLSSSTIRLCGITGSALLIFSLGFSLKAYAWGLGRNGLNMTVLAIGTSLTIAAAAQSSWRAPRLLSPLLVLGQRSYEIYLTHVFVVMILFAIFLRLGKPIQAVPLLFLATIRLCRCTWVVRRCTLFRADEPRHSTEGRWRNKAIRKCRLRRSLSKTLRPIHFACTPPSGYTSSTA